MSDATLRGIDHRNPKGDIVKDLLHEALVRGVTFARNLSFRTWPYGLSLRGPMPDRFLVFPKDLMPGSAQTATSLLAGRYDFPGGSVQAKPTTSPWTLVPPNEVWAESLHGFTWLAHLDGFQNGAAKKHVEWLITRWMAECGQWHDIGWRPQVIGQRLISLFLHAKFISEGSDLIWRSELMCSIARQARHLERTAKWANEGEDRLVASIGLTLSGLCLPHGESRLEAGMTLLMRELNKQILPDGGHVSRNPSVQLTTLVQLCLLQDLLQDQSLPVPDEFDETIQRMAPMVRFFRHNDGRLALFNGSTEEKGGAVDAVLAKTSARKPFTRATHSGFQRAKAGRTNLIVDAGAPLRPEFSQSAHAGCLSFEMCVGRHRLITNCGSTSLKGPAWRNASRSTAAHSTLTLADQSSLRFLEQSFAARLLGPRVTEAPSQIVSERDENEHGVWIHTAHDGYLKRFGVWHERRFFLSADGEDLRGEDCVVAAAADGREDWREIFRHRPDDQHIPFAIRFHLHPDVKPSLSRDGNKVLLLLSNGDGWTFQTDAPSVTLEDSVYLGSGHAVRQSRQIVVSGVADTTQRTTTKWALYRMARDPGRKQKA